MAKIQILIGMIASGKSSYCKNIARKGHLCINDDAIVNMLHADQYNLYDQNLKLLYKSIENHIISSALCLNKNVLIDRALNISFQGRQRYIALAKSFDVKCEALVFTNEGPEVHALRRTQSDCRGYDLDYWMRVAKTHDKLYCEPTLEEGFDNIYQVSFEQIQKNQIIGE